MGMKQKGFNDVMADKNLCLFTIHDLKYSSDLLMAEVGEDEQDLVHCLLADLGKGRLDHRGVGGQESSVAAKLNLGGTTQ